MRKVKAGILFWATLSIAIPNSVVNRSTAAFCATYDYQPIINGLPNAETPIQFMQRTIANFIKQVVISYEVTVVARQAQQSQQVTTTSDVSGIQ